MPFFCILYIVSFQGSHIKIHMKREVPVQVNIYVLHILNMCVNNSNKNTFNHPYLRLLKYIIISLVLGISNCTLIRVAQNSVKADK